MTVRTCGENYRGVCGNENMDDESDRALKNRKTKTEIIIIIMAGMAVV